MQCMPELLSKSKWKVREGNVKLWYDNFLDSGPLFSEIPEGEHSHIRLKELFINNVWDVENLQMLLGLNKAEEVIERVGYLRSSSDILLWLPEKNGCFTTKSAWDAIRFRAPNFEWAKWVWHKWLPKKIAICMWKAAFECLSVDEKVRRVGVSLASACDCCDSRQSEDLEHVLNKGEFATDIWRKVSVELTGLLEGVDFSIKHSYREGNKVADALARQGAMGRNNLFTNSAQLPRIIKVVESKNASTHAENAEYIELEGISENDVQSRVQNNPDTVIPRVEQAAPQMEQVIPPAARVRHRHTEAWTAVEDVSFVIHCRVAGGGLDFFPNFRGVHFPLFPRKIPCLFTMERMEASGTVSERRDEVSIQIENPDITLTTFIRQKLDTVSTLSLTCSIHRVPKMLRSLNDAAYTPQVISIGPFHRDKESLRVMEEHKWIYLRVFLDRCPQIELEDYVKALRGLEETARQCYAEPIKLCSDEFVEMMLLDGFVHS
ncbi:hypothetical protein HHK36_025941 [Tetracentron sinense]|uniref:Reverse transcriptase zinc-binding domain-containing protein n=1 Tax=Tetracentron sinense TaxID=13715 RepID=A0A835D3L4_TETSI|nr:hypothetical protein HHK36_025941 [Tetracentron sinense]